MKTKRFLYCQSQIEGQKMCKTQCDHCKEYYKPLEEQIIWAENIINWGELSRILSGSRQTVRKNKIPKIHRKFVSDLLKAIDKAFNKLPDRAKERGKKLNNKELLSDAQSKK